MGVETPQTMVHDREGLWGSTVVCPCMLHDTALIAGTVSHATRGRRCGQMKSRVL